MTDGGVHTGYYFIERLGSRQTEPLYLDFSYHFKPLQAQPPLERGIIAVIVLCSSLSPLRFSAREKRCPVRRRR
jgi:hypothetical protein